MTGLELRRLTKRYLLHGEPIPACREVSLTVGEGEFVSLVGPSGCGKSTLLEVVAGLLEPDTGEALLHGEPVRPGQCSYMPQDDLLFPWRTILSNVALPLQIAGVKRDERERQALELLREFGLDRYARSRPDQLSGGMRQRVAFMRTVLHRRDLWLLDEPFARLDALTRHEMQDWLIDIHNRFHQSVLFVTHDLEEAVVLSNRIYVMSAAPGEIVAEAVVDVPRAPGMRSDPRFIALKSRLAALLEPGVAS
jgi:ABC-type nitrate/sulfonate/bicarbonate transport system ATPase subunit